MTVVLSRDLKRIFGGFTDIPWSKEVMGNHWDRYRKIAHNHKSFVYKYDENKREIEKLNSVEG